ncbi:MAG TPA: lysylphosphatidylglycerol synthase transmembrane domain-containing protein [Chryseosolibacter sp.]|nr:lysylphosphatidylglycerol synthase transmembrane domain-containing protein [Chryseosolibacter sp.]
MSRPLKTFLQYAFIFGITGLLIWVSLRGLTGENKGEILLETWKTADKGWLTVMAVVAMMSHLLRAERWRMLLEPSGFTTKLRDSFLSLMVGYLVNLVIPRGGEVSRCYNLYKLDNTPVEMSFGTVVVERIVDLVCLLSLLILAFLIESDKLFAFMSTLPIGSGGSSSVFTIVAIGIGALFLTGLIIFWLIRRHNKLRAFFARTWLGFKDGFLSIFKLKNKGLFIFYSISIWALYFLMSYTVILAFPETKHLGVEAVLSLFAIGSIAMAVPLPGGTGSYHVLVPQGLVFLYAIPQPDAVAFTFIFHGWQTAILIAGGALSLIATSIILKRRK